MEVCLILVLPAFVETPSHTVTNFNSVIIFSIPRHLENEMVV